MPEGGLQVHGVVMTPSVSAYVEHARPPQIADQSPHSPLREGHLVRDLPDGALWIDGNVEKHGAMAGHQVPVVLDCYSPAVAIFVPLRILIHVMQSL